MSEQPWTIGRGLALSRLPLGLVFPGPQLPRARGDGGGGGGFSLRQPLRLSAE
jgi:hypothetical protein